MGTSAGVRCVEKQRNSKVVVFGPAFAGKHVVVAAVRLAELAPRVGAETSPAEVWERFVRTVFADGLKHLDSLPGNSCGTKLLRWCAPTGPEPVLRRHTDCARPASRRRYQRSDFERGRCAG